jgi:nitrogen PTS system EIIA component
MRVTVHEAAKLLTVTDDRIYEWIESGDLPAYRINEQFRINRTELLEWATLRNLDVSPALFYEAEGEAHIPRISEALGNARRAGEVSGNTRAAVLRAIVDRLDLKPAERAMLVDLLIARDETAFVSLPDGIAIPHVRHPIVLTEEPVLYVFHLHDQIEFLGSQVHIVFLLLTPTIRAHLQLVSKLSHMLRNDAFRDALRSGNGDLAAVAQRIEAQTA